MPTIDLATTGKPKRDLIEMAFEDCGSAGYEFERTPEEIASALRKLDAMMAEWPFSLLGYSASDYGTGSPADLSGIPDSTVHVVAASLALRIAPSMGKALAPEQRAAHARSLHLLSANYATIPTAYIAQNTPRGSGHRHRYPFISEYPET